MACFPTALLVNSGIQLGAPLSKQEAEHFRRRREQPAAAGALHSALARLAAIEARAWLIVGDWRALRLCFE